MNPVMRFVPHATPVHSMSLCACCSEDIRIGQAIYVGELKVLCGPCHDYVREAVLEATRQTLVEAAQIARCSADVPAAWESLIFKARLIHAEQAAL